jgi:hypothetical protein
VDRRGMKDIRVFVQKEMGVKILTFQFYPLNIHGLQTSE